MSQRVGENLWVKRDDLTHPRYGGNKARKLAHVLPDAARRGARRLVTLGAVGSHHVLATALFARDAGLPVLAGLFPQERSAHVVEVARATLAAGVDVRAAGSPRQALVALAKSLRRGDLLLPPGGSSVAGVHGYVGAAHEIAAAVAGGDAPLPDVIVVATGSGGTVAGLALGLAATRLRTRVLAVSVVDPPLLAHAAVRALIAQSAFATPALARAALALVDFEDRFLGIGYGAPTAAGSDASEEATARGLGSDATYTAKAFAAAIALSRTGKTVLYVHTLSAAPMAPLLVGAPAERDLPRAIASLLV